MNTTHIKVISVLLQVVVFQFLFQGCSSNKTISINVKPVSIAESKDKINFNIVFAHADDLEDFSFYYKYIDNKVYENVYIDKLFYDNSTQGERSYRYPAKTIYRSYSAGNMLRKNAETVFKSIFSNATTLHIPGDDHFTGIIIDHQSYKEIVPPNTIGIIKLKSPQVNFYLDCKQPDISFSSSDLTAELIVDWELVDLDGNTIWKKTITGFGTYDYRLLESMKKKVCDSFQPAIDQHFKNLAIAIENSPEIRLYEALLQIDKNILLSDPSSVHEILNSFQNIQERTQITNKLLYWAIEKNNNILLKELLSTPYIDLNQADRYYLKLPIHLAVQKNNFEATKLLISNQSGVNIPDSSGFTPLHYAVSNGYTKITDLLIQNGSDVNAKNTDGQTPFSLAVANDHENDWQLLLDNGANPDAINEEDLLWTAELYNRIGLYLGEKGDKNKSTEIFKTASNYFEKASLLYNRVSKKAEIDAFVKDMFDFTLLVVNAWGSQWQAQQTAKQYAEIQALNDAHSMGLSQTQTLTLIHNYKSNALKAVAISPSVSMPVTTGSANTANKHDIAKYYSQLSEICDGAANKIKIILDCYEEHGEQFKECLPTK